MYSVRFTGSHQGQINLFTHGIQLMNPDRDQITHGHQLAWVLDKVLAHIGNMNEAVFVNTDVHKGTEIHYVADYTF